MSGQQQWYCCLFTLWFNFYSVYFLALQASKYRHLKVLRELTVAKTNQMHKTKLKLFNSLHHFTRNTILCRWKLACTMLNRLIPNKDPDGSKNPIYCFLFFRQLFPEHFANNSQSDSVMVPSFVQSVAFHTISSPRSWPYLNRNRIIAEWPGLFRLISFVEKLKEIKGGHCTCNTWPHAKDSHIYLFVYIRTFSPETNNST